MAADQHDIQHSILEMQSKRSRLGIKKQEIQAEVNKIKEMLKYVQQGHETFTELVSKKNKFVAELNEIDVDIMQLKNDIKKRNLLKEEVKGMEQPKTVALQAEIIVLRDYYLKFAGDKTRVASMRAMSAEFAEALTKIVKKSKFV